jgi:hypothetical protein
MQLSSLFSSWTRLLRRERLDRRQRSALPTGCGQRGLALELLEDRLAPATLTVNSSADTASNCDAYLTLREALAIVNSSTLPSGLSDQILGQISGILHDGGSDTIAFDPNAVTGPIVLGGTQLELSLPGSTATVTIDGGARVTLDGNNASRVLKVDAGVQASLDHLTLSNGSALADFVNPRGGGISNAGVLTVTDSILSSNSAGVGGAISNVGTLTLSNSTLSANEALAGTAGGIYNAGLLTVTSSTISANVGIFGGIDNVGTLTVTNSTIVSNQGGGIANTGRLTVTSCTISGNRAPFEGGGIRNSSGSASLQNTIVAGNSSSVNPGPDIFGAVDSSSSYNLVGIGDSTLTGISDGSNGNQIGTPDNPIDPRLSPLGDQGGPTQTMPLLPGSPALNTGDPTLLGTTDQRGVVRSGGVNIGAFQASAAYLVVTGPDSATAGVPFDISVAVYDSFGQLAVGYTGTIHFTTSDSHPNVVLPPDYTFQVSDSGVVTFSAGATLFTPGDQTLTATDLDSGISGSTVVTL